MGDLDAFDRVITSIHDAMLDDSRWRESSVLIDEACGTKGNHLVIVDRHARGPDRGIPEWLFDECYFRGEPRPEFGREYVEDFFPHDERVPRLMQLPDRRVTHVSDLYSERELKTSATYNDLLRRTECQSSLHLRMNGPDGLDVILVFADPIDAAGWSSGRIETLERLVPHIRQFVRVRHALVSADGLAASLADLLDRTNFGVIYLDQRGTIVNANSNARAVLREGDGLSDRGGFLRARLAADDAKLAEPVAGRPAGPREPSCRRFDDGRALAPPAATRAARTTRDRTPHRLLALAWGRSTECGGARAGGRSRQQNTHRRRHRGGDTSSHPSREPGCGGFGRRQHRTRHRHSHAPTGELRQVAGQADTREVRHHPTGGVGAYGDLRGYPRLGIHRDRSTLPACSVANSPAPLAAHRASWVLPPAPRCAARKASARPADDATPPLPLRRRPQAHPADRRAPFEPSRSTHSRPA